MYEKLFFLSSVFTIECTSCSIIYSMKFIRFVVIFPIMKCLCKKSGSDGTKTIQADNFANKLSCGMFSSSSSWLTRRFLSESNLGYKWQMNDRYFLNLQSQLCIVFWDLLCFLRRAVRHEKACFSLTIATFRFNHKKLGDIFQASHATKTFA